MLNEQIKQQIQQAYRDYLASKGFRPRQGQMQLIAHASRELMQEPAQVAVAEAGTGTGKTLAYLLAGYFVSQARGLQLIISTATLALQEQLVLRDIPDFVKATGIELNYELAKGRGRYLCLSRLELALDEEQMALSHLQSGLDLQPHQRQQAETVVEQMQLHLNDYAKGRWNGEFDALANPPKPELLSRMTANHRQCSQRRCAHYDSCAFYRSRAKLEKAQLIVVNHDLLLSDLALGGGVVLPAPDQCLHVLDEGHHLAEKALDHFAGACHLDALLDGISPLLKRLEQLKLDTLVLGLATDVTQVQDYLRQLQQQWQFLRAYLQDAWPMSQGQRHRFVMGQLPDELQSLVQPSMQSLQLLVPLLDKIQRLLLASIKERSELLDKALVEHWHQQLGMMLMPYEAALQLHRLWTSVQPEDQAPISRWLEMDAQGWLLAASPVSAGGHLRQLLWNRTAGALVTSATLTFAGRFDRFLGQIGLATDSACLRVFSPFNYPQSVLQVPRSVPDANQAQAHSQWMIEQGLGLIDPQERSLVLFASRRQMEEVCEQWRKQQPKWPWRVQGEESRQLQLQGHRDAAKAGKGSILIGLASLAEGLDLPGDLLTHVIIAKLPFATPDDPINATLAEWLTSRGHNPFMSISVPDVAIKLVQACGRLLRSEQDVGRITLCDNRVYSKAYGQQLLASLPPFTKKRS